MKNFYAIFILSLFAAAAYAGQSANLEEQNKTQEYKSELIKHILSSTGLGTEKYETDFKEKFPKVYINLMEFSKECGAYITFVEECGIIKDLGKYIVVSKLDK